MKSLLAATIFLLLTAGAHAEFTMEHLERFVQEHKSDDVIAAATAAVSRPEEKKVNVWLSPLAELKPVRAYRDRVNPVVVTSESGSHERGIYISHPRSSHLPHNDQEWQVTHVKDGIYVFERTKKPQPCRSMLSERPLKRTPSSAQK